METFHGTTILSVRRDGAVALGGDGQVTLGNVVVKATARKVRRLYHDRVLAGFAGATADAFTLFERFEAKLDKHQGHLTRAAVELAKDWRSDRILRRLEAMLAVADRTRRRSIDHRHRRRARAGARHRRDRLGRPLRAGRGAGAARAHGAVRPPTSSSRRSTIAGDLCIYTNQNHVIETLGASRAMTQRSANADCDVLIAGAGLVGLALAPRARASGPRAWRSSIARRSRRPATGRRRRLGCARLRDQPGQRRVPARRWARGRRCRRAHRADRDDARRGRRRRGARILGAYELGERALAWIVEERALRAALVPLVHARRRRRSIAPRTLRVDRAGRRSAATLAFDDGGSDRRAARRRRRRRALVGPRGRGHRRRAAALRADGGRRQFRLRARAPRPRAPVVPATTAASSRGCRCRAAASRSSGRRPRRWRSELLALDPRRARARASRRPGGTRSARSTASRRPRRFRCSSCSCRRSSRTGSRWSATPRTACIRSPGRASTWASATPRRSPPCCASAGPVADAGAPILLERYARRRARSRCSRCRRSPTGSPSCSGIRAPWVAVGCATSGLSAVDRLPPRKAPAGAICAALDAVKVAATNLLETPDDAPMHRQLLRRARRGRAARGWRARSRCRSRRRRRPPAAADDRAEARCGARSCSSRSSPARRCATSPRRRTSASTRCSSTTSSSTPTPRSTT